MGSLFGQLITKNLALVVYLLLQSRCVRREAGLGERCAQPTPDAGNQRRLLAESRFDFWFAMAVLFEAVVRLVQVYFGQYPGHRLDVWGDLMGAAYVPAMVAMVLMLVASARRRRGTRTNPDHAPTATP
jgi:hypothetical protein